MERDLQLYLRITQALFAIFALGLNSSVISYFSSHVDLGPMPGPFVFLVFASVYTLLIALPYATFAPHYFRHIITPYTSLAVESITNIFWFCGFIAGAAYVGKLSSCIGLICGCARAGIAFSAIEWLLWCATLFFPVQHLLSRRMGNSEETPAGMGNTREVSMGQRFKGWKLRREAGDTSKFQQNGQEREGMAQKFKQGLDVFKIRTDNVLGGLREKGLRRGSMV